MTDTKVVWPGLKAFWFSKDNPTEHNKKKEKKSWKTILQSGQESSTRAAEIRTRWKGIVAKSSVMPQQSSKLWERKEKKRTSKKKNRQSEVLIR